MSVIWIGVGYHVPKKEHYCSIERSLMWQTKMNDNTLYNYLKQNPNNILAGLSEVSLRSDRIYIKNNDVTDQIKDFSHLLLLWNCFNLSSEDIIKISKIETYIKDKNPNIHIINPIEMFDIVYQKDKFFSLLQEHGYGKYTPQYLTIKSIFDLSKIPLNYPYIIKLNSSTGGKDTYLIKNIIERYHYYFILKFEIWWRKINTEVLAVQYFNTFNDQHRHFTSYRIIMHNDKIAYCYPHVSTTNWCIHTDMEESSPNIIAYHFADKNLNEFISRKKEIFSSLRKIIGLHTVAIDFLIINDEPIFLEVELKYGCDENFIKGQEKRYNLDEQYYLKKLKAIGSSEASFEDIFS